MQYEKELLEEMWRKMNLSREFEERVQWLFSMGLVHGTTHLGVGEEATAVGSILALKPEDWLRFWQGKRAYVRGGAAPCILRIRISIILGRTESWEPAR